MGYSWQGKEDICRQLYITQGRSLDEVIGILKEVYHFTPSKRAFQLQFRRWGFPSKHHPAYQNQALVGRIRELWEQNTRQKDMLAILQAEDFCVNDRALMRVRAKNHWLMRVPNGGKGYGYVGDESEPDRKRDEEGDVLETSVKEDSVGQEPIHNEGCPEEDSNDTHECDDTNRSVQTRQDSISLPINNKVERGARLEQLRQQSDTLWASRKRRRRTRGYAGLPADPPRPPRFPSETTLDESKAFLHMDNARYRDMRDQFQRICEEVGFKKKTEAGSDQWQAAKKKLIANNAHLNKQFHGPYDGVSTESKSLALDVVCTDVTKRMRTIEKKVTIAEAKNILGLNPVEGRLVRSAFYDILLAHNFLGKLEMGDERWHQLKQKWIDESEVLQRILGPEGTHSEQAGKIKAMNILSRDVMKRLRDDQNKANPASKRQVHNGPGPGPAAPSFLDMAHTVKSPRVQRTPRTTAMQLRPPRHQEGLDQRTSDVSSTGYTGTSHLATKQHHNQASSQQIDPSLLAAASETSLADRLREYTHTTSSGTIGLFNPDTPHDSSAASYTHQTYRHTSAHRDASNESPAQLPTDDKPHDQTRSQHQSYIWAPRTTAEPVWFRLHRSSTPDSSPILRLSMLTSLSINCIQQTAAKLCPGSRVEKVQGVLTDESSAIKAETEVDLTGDAQVEAYIGFVGKGKGIFAVQVVDA